MKKDLNLFHLKISFKINAIAVLRMLLTPLRSATMQLITQFIFKAGIAVHKTPNCQQNVSFHLIFIQFNLPIGKSTLHRL